MDGPIDKMIAPGAAASRAEASPKRQQIVDAAVALFLAHGYGLVSMDAVAKGAGVSKATLYAYFNSKAQLFATIIGDACREKTEDDSIFPEQTDDIAAALGNIADRMLHFLIDPRRLAIYRMTLAESLRFPELGEVYLENGPYRFRDRVSLWMARMAGAGHLTIDDPVVAAEHFLGMLQTGMLFRIRLGIGPLPDEAEIAATGRAAVGTFLRAFGK